MSPVHPLRRISDEETLGKCKNEWLRSVLLRHIGLGENPRDAAMVDVAKDLDYELSGTVHGYDT